MAASQLRLAPIAARFPNPRHHSRCSVEDTLFSFLHLLAKARRCPGWKETTIKLVLEALQLFLVFNGANKGRGW